MRIGIEAERANLPNPTGVERYAAELIRNLAKLDSKNEYVLYFRTPPQQWFLDLPKNFSIRLIPFPKFWTQLRISWEMITHPVDILIIPASTMPFIHPKTIVTVHDIAYELFDGIYTGFMNYYQKFFSRYAAKHATKLLTVSHSTKNDLIKVYKTDPKKIQVTHLGFDSGEFRPRSYEEVQQVLDKYGLVYQKYVLFVGTIQPRKNIPALAEAFQKLRKENRIEEKLAIFGQRGWLWEPILKKVKNAGIDGSIKYYDYAPKKDLPFIYAGAKILTLPALYEGFGFPPLEAMASDVPVVVSNLSSLPEVVGEAGKLVDPHSVDSIAAGLLSVLTDGNLRQAMIVKGREQVKKFSWESTAKKTLEVIESLK